MTTRKKEPRLIKRDSAQAIVETAAGLIVVTIVAVALIAGGIDTYATIVGTEKLRLAAQAAANVYSDGLLLYNCYYIESKEPQARENAVAVANRVLDTLGIGRSRDIQLTREMQNGALIARANVSANVLIPFAGLTHFPGLVKVTGIAAHGFSSGVRVFRMTIPAYPDNNGNANASDPKKFTEYVGHIGLNIPCFDASFQFLSPPNLASPPKIFPEFPQGTFPGGADTVAGGNVVGRCYSRPDLEGKPGGEVPDNYGRFK